MLFEGLRNCSAFLEVRHTSAINFFIVLTSSKHLFHISLRYHDNAVFVGEDEITRMKCNGWKSFFRLRTVGTGLNSDWLLKDARTYER
jgi:hypothetical protein